MSYRRILIGEVKPGDDVLTGAGDLFRVTLVEVADDAVCLHGHDFVGSGFNALFGTFTDAHTATVVRIRKSPSDEEPKWYKGPLTKRRVADLREKLGNARGMLMSVKQDIESEDEDVFKLADDIQIVIDQTADP